MIYDGKAITVNTIDNRFAELAFNLSDESVNKFNQLTVKELGEAIDALASTSENIEGLLMVSRKDVFIVGADITEFLGMFSQEEDDIIQMLTSVTDIFNRIEDLPFPTVSLINGIALGGGFEVCLSTDYRIMSKGAKVGLPEVKLGIFPGWGGSVRLPRLIGADNAIEWICTGKEQSADDALSMGAVDAVVESDDLFEAGVDLLTQCSHQKFNYERRREEKKSSLRLNSVEQMMVFETAKPFIKSKAGPHYPAPLEAVKVMQKHANKKREDAHKIEAQHFAKMAKTTVAASLVGIFLNDQALKKKNKSLTKNTNSVTKAAVLGAGIMGGGISYQSAYRGVPIIMKDINDSGLSAGLDEAKKLLAKRVERGRMTVDKMADTLNLISPTLSYGDFKSTDLIVEAVVENESVKKSVLSELEQEVNDDTVITSNTSTISIDALAGALKRPENFCGMHFFNPVHMMPLVEVIRGEKTSDDTIAKTVSYALALGKKPIVVNDCPGFLVNRVLFPYFHGFSALVRDGIDFQRIDKLMERFGWPMGPAYLLDVVGMDTAVHAGKVMADGYPSRMSTSEKSAIDVMFENQRLGQKNDKGFYQYTIDKKGKSKKEQDDAVAALLQPVIKQQIELEDEQIIARMMIPLCLETVRCLEEGIVSSAYEADLGLVYGIGFPPFLGGALNYIDSMGVKSFCDLADSFSELGELYTPTDQLRSMAGKGQSFFN